MQSRVGEPSKLRCRRRATVSVFVEPVPESTGQLKVRDTTHVPYILSFLSSVREAEELRGEASASTPKDVVSINVWWSPPRRSSVGEGSPREGAPDTQAIRFG
jgi:hypothetical protein